MASKYLVGLFFLYTILGPGCSGEGAEAVPLAKEPQHRPNVVVVLVDTLRADHLGCYGYTRSTSPNIDRLATEGVLFENAYAPSSFTRESIAALFSGKYPSSNPWGSGWVACPDPDAPALAGIFKENGYTCSMFFNNPAIDDKVFRKDFDHVEQVILDASLSGAEDELSGKALAHLDSLEDGQPFLMYIHYLDPHSPYDPAERYYLQYAKEKFAHPIELVNDVRGHIPELLAEGFGPGEARFEDLVLRYDAEIKSTDEAVGVLLDGLQDRGLDKNTIIVFMADHGEEFLEHGFVEHAWDIRRESIHVPFIFWAPDIFSARRISAPVSTVNLLPTLLQLTSMSIEAEFDGYSLYQGSDWQTKDVPIFAELLIQSRVMMRMALQGEYVYFASPQWLDVAARSRVALEHKEILKQIERGERTLRPIWGEVEQEFLYKIQDDAKQKNNILGEAQGIADKYREILRDYQSKCPPNKSEFEQRARTEFGITEEMQNTLDNLGYL